MHTFQDDKRENYMRTLFNLTKDESEGRCGIDAFLNVKGKKVPFELKSTSKNSVTTVRDFSHSHIEKWQDKHWLIGFFNNGAEHYKYASPKMMKPWIVEKQKIIETDMMLGELLANTVTVDVLHSILTPKASYSIDDAKTLLKRQYNEKQYKEAQDIEDGYSSDSMVNFVQDRLKYLIHRGSSLNNPHIPASYFDSFETIEVDHANHLRQLVQI